MPFVTAPPDPHPAPGLRERKKRAARAAIVDAALDLFADRGFEHTTVADVADRAGVSPATVARYFDSKESLLFSEHDERLPALARSIAGRPSDERPYRAVLCALHEQPWAEGDTDAAAAAQPTRHHPLPDPAAAAPTCSSPVGGTPSPRGWPHGACRPTRRG